MKRVFFIFAIYFVIVVVPVYGKHGESEYKVPEGLVNGAAFIDLFKPIPIHDGLETDVWGAANVIPRDMHNGIEDSKWSYWGGNVLTGPDGKEHMFVCRWLESSKKGHMEWRNSLVVHAVAEKPTGPFFVKHEIGMGHNPEIYRAKDGTYVISVINGCYQSKSLDGPWKKTKLDLDLRETPKAKLSNLTFTRREDGSILMVSRAGQVWISKDGLAPFMKVTTQSVYPKIKGRFEDPVVWRDEIQYHLIVNDWYGRIAFHLRSKDGIHWKWDDGEAYTPEVIQLEDGTKEGWYKLERSKIRQDEFGRATHMYFAVIDTNKRADLGNDNHSSKNVSVPLLIGRRIKILNKENLTKKSGDIRIKIIAEKGFDPQVEVDVKSLTFGATEKVNFGMGCKAIKSEVSGSDMVVTFNGKGHGLTENNFTAKLIGKTSKGELLYGYARLPWQTVVEPALFARPVKLTFKDDRRLKISTLIENFGQVPSSETGMKLTFLDKGKEVHSISCMIPKISAYGNQKVLAETDMDKLGENKKYDIDIVINPDSIHPEVLRVKNVKIPRP